MLMKLRSIVIWPKDREKRFRRVDFADGVINVITGQSGSGKSSLIHIVDYCLGSGKCAIPVGVIRDTVEWFGVVLQLADSQLLLARRNPEEKDQTGDVFILQDAVVDLEEVQPEKNANIDFLKQRLNGLAGLPNIGFDPTKSSGFMAAPSFRDLAAFLYQPQHIIANPNTIFFKADTYEHREKLRAVLPFVLGAVTSEQLVARHKLLQLQAELDKHQSVLDRQRQAAESSAAELRAYALRAQEIGLLPPTDTIARDSDTDRLLDVLRLIPRRLADGQGPVVGVAAADPVLLRLRELEQQEEDLARELSRKQRRRLQIERLKASVDNYSGQLVSQEARLTGIGWLSKRISSEGQCPFCGSDSQRAIESLEALKELASEMQELSSRTSLAHPALDRELNTLVEASQQIEQQLRTAREEKWLLEDESVVLAERRRTEVEAFRLAGRIDQLLDIHKAIAVDSDLLQTIELLREQAVKLREVTNAAVERARLSGAVQRFTQHAAKYIEVLRLPRIGDPLELRVDDLMVRVLNDEGRADALWEIGSAENWVGYHIATMLALHELFLRLPNSPVPTFLMVDQPSQAYFPDRWPGDNEESQEPLDEASDDIAGVHRIFETLSTAISRTNGELQVIVVDHAGDITWAGVESVNLIGNWRRGHDEFLVPDDWLT